MKKIVLSIEGMSCSACSIGLEKYLKKKKGIIDASVNLVMAEALITYEDNLTEEDLAEMIKKAGFKLESKQKASDDVEEDLVIETEPSKNRYAKKGSTIIIYYSL